MWVVTLPKLLNIKPVQKYFPFSNHGGKENALVEARAYRDLNLNQWLQDRGGLNK